MRVSSGKGTIALPAGAEQAINAIAARQPTVLISFGSPYLITQVPNVASYLLAWAATPTSETAVANALTGAAAITGQVADPDSARRGRSAPACSGRRT